MKRLALTLTAAAVLTTAGVATAYAVQSDDKPTPSASPTSSPTASPTTSSNGVPTGSLTAAKAVAQALKDVPGGVVTDVDWDNSKWELDVHTTAGWRELSYDANGKLLSNRADNHGDDHADDRSDDSGNDSAQDRAENKADRSDDSAQDRAEDKSGRSDDKGGDDHGKQDDDN
ncbi:hypothetical protein ACFVWG_11205 [Kribbella sp. NPDC058245]|uniref:hypothetical protein n=1 Tax=Kribbella sp. NPDC058245 TaxID=3346399 RepID=UPI0036ED2ED8